MYSNTTLVKVKCCFLYRKPKNLFIQIQHLLKLNKVEAGQTLELTKNSNTTLVKVKYPVFKCSVKFCDYSNTTLVKVK